MQWPGDVLAGDDARALLPVAREREARDAVALGADQLVGVVEGEDDVVHALVVHEVDDRAGAADDQQRIVGIDELRSLLVARLVVGLLLAEEIVGAVVRPLRHQLAQVQRVVEPRRGVDLLHLVAISGEVTERPSGGST